MNAFSKAIKMTYRCKSCNPVTVEEFRKAKRSFMTEVIRESFLDQLRLSGP